MSINVSVTADKERIKGIMRNPLLFDMTQDGKPEDWEPDFDKHVYLLGEYLGDGYAEDCGIMTVNRFTGLTCEAHIYIDPIFWGAGIGEGMVHEVAKWLLQHTEFTQAVTYSPTACVQVQVLLKKVGFMCTGKLDKCMIYREELSDLFIFQGDLKTIINKGEAQ